MARFERHLARLVLNYLHKEGAHEAYDAFCSSSPHLTDVWHRRQAHDAPYALYADGQSLHERLHELRRLCDMIKNYIDQLPSDRGALLGSLDSTEQQLWAVLDAVDERRLRRVKRRRVQEDDDDDDDAHDYDSAADDRVGASDEENHPSAAAFNRSGTPHLNNSRNRPNFPSARRSLNGGGSAMSHSKRQRAANSSAVTFSSTPTGVSVPKRPSLRSGGRKPATVAFHDDATVEVDAEEFASNMHEHMLQQQQPYLQLQPTNQPDDATDTMAADVYQAYDDNMIMINLESLLETTEFHHVLADSINNVLHTPNKQIDAEPAAAATASQQAEFVDQQPAASQQHQQHQHPERKLQDALNAQALSAIVSNATDDPSFERLVHNVMHPTNATDGEAGVSGGVGDSFRSRLRSRKPHANRSCYLEDGPKRSYQKRGTSSSSTAAAAATTATATTTTAASSSVQVLSNETYDGRLGSAEDMVASIMHKQQPLPAVAEVCSLGQPPTIIVAPPPPGHFYALPGGGPAVDGQQPPPAQLIAVSSLGVQRYVVVGNLGVIDGVRGSVEAGAIIDVSRFSPNNSSEPAAEAQAQQQTEEPPTVEEPAASAETAAVPPPSEPPAAAADAAILNHSDKENQQLLGTAAEPATLPPQPTATPLVHASNTASLQLKAKALSTPRRHSHVRVLDFNTPANALNAAAAAGTQAQAANTSANTSVASTTTTNVVPASAPPKVSLAALRAAAGGGGASSDDAKEAATERTTAATTRPTKGTASATKTTARVRLRRKTMAAATAPPVTIDEESLPIATLLKTGSSARLRSRAKSTASTTPAPSSTTTVARKSRSRVKCVPIAPAPQDGLETAADTTTATGPPNTEQQLDAWQQLRAIRPDEWDNHMREQCANMPVKRPPRAPPKRKRRTQPKAATTAAARKVKPAPKTIGGDAAEGDGNDESLNVSVLGSPDTSLTSLHGDLLAAALRSAVKPQTTVASAKTTTAATTVATATLEVIVEEEPITTTTTTTTTTSTTPSSTTTACNKTTEKEAIKKDTHLTKTPKKTERFSIKLPASAKKKDKPQQQQQQGRTQQQPPHPPTDSHNPLLATEATVIDEADNAVHIPLVSRNAAGQLDLASLLETPFKFDDPHSNHTDLSFGGGDNSMQVPPTPGVSLQSSLQTPAVKIQPRSVSAASAPLSELRFGEYPTPVGIPKTPGTSGTPPMSAHSQDGHVGGGGSSYYRPDEAEDVDLLRPVQRKTTVAIIPTLSTVVETSAEIGTGKASPAVTAGATDGECDEPIHYDSDGEAAAELRAAEPTTSNVPATPPSRNTSTSSSSSSSSSTSDRSSSGSSSDCSSRPSSAASNRFPTVASDLQHATSVAERLQQQQRLAEAGVAALAERQRLEELAVAEEEAAQRRYAAQAAQAAKLAAARERTKNRLRVETTRESFKPQASLAHRKGKLAQRQGFAAAVAAAAQQKPLLGSGIASSAEMTKARTPATTTKAKTSKPKLPTPAKAASPHKKTTVGAVRKTICLNTPIPQRRNVRRKTTDTKVVTAPGKPASSSTAAGSSNAPMMSAYAGMPWTSPEFLGFPTPQHPAPAEAATAAVEGDSSEGEAFQQMTRTRQKKADVVRKFPDDEDNDNSNDGRDDKQGVQTLDKVPPLPAERQPPAKTDPEPSAVKTHVPPSSPTTASRTTTTPPPPPEPSTYTSSYAETSVGGYKAQVRDLFGDAALSDSDFMDTPVKMPAEEEAHEEGDGRFSDVLPALALMPTPQKTSTPNAEEQLKRNAAAQAVGSAASAITFVAPLQQPQSQQQTIKLPAKKRKTTVNDATPTPAGGVLSSLLAVQSNPMLAALQTPMKQSQKTPPPAPQPSSIVANSSAEVRAAVASLGITPLRGYDANGEQLTTTTAENSPVEAAAPPKQSTKDTAPTTESNAAVKKDAVDEDDDDDDACSDESMDNYDECSLHRSNDRHPHVAIVQCQAPADARPVHVPAGSIPKIRAMPVQLEENLVIRLRPSETFELHEAAPRVEAMAPAAAAVPRKTSASVRPANGAGMGRPLTSSTPVTVPRVRVSYKPKGTSDRMNAPEPFVAPTTVRPTAAPQPPSEQQRDGSPTPPSTTAAMTSANVRLFDVNLVLGKVHPTKQT